jgi:hypothetical protein
MYVLMLMTFPRPESKRDVKAAYFGCLLMLPQRPVGTVVFDHLTTYKRFYLQKHYIKTFL